MNHSVFSTLRTSTWIWQIRVILKISVRWQKYTVFEYLTYISQMLRWISNYYEKGYNCQKNHVPCSQWSKEKNWYHFVNDPIYRCSALLPVLFLFGACPNQPVDNKNLIICGCCHQRKTWLFHSAWLWNAQERSGVDVWITSQVQKCYRYSDKIAKSLSKST